MYLGRAIDGHLIVYLQQQKQSNNNDGTVMYIFYIKMPDGKFYKINNNKNMKNVMFLSDVPNEDLPGLYQMAQIFIYPSRFEGFGIPILEALASHTPVITSSGGVFSEAGGSSSAYIDPDNLEELAATIRKILEDSTLQASMSEQGFLHAMQFTEDIIAENIMQVYKKAISLPAEGGKVLRVKIGQDLVNYTSDIEENRITRPITTPSGQDFNSAEHLLADRGLPDGHLFGHHCGGPAYRARGPCIRDQSGAPGYYLSGQYAAGLLHPTGRNEPVHRQLSFQQTGDDSLYRHHSILPGFAGRGTDHHLLARTQPVSHH